MFNVKDKQIKNDGILLLNTNGYVCEYDKNDSPFIFLANGSDEMYISLGNINSYRIDKNKAYVKVSIIGKNTIQVKVTYSGQITEISESDLINVYKYLSAADRKLWLEYATDREKMYERMYFVIQTEYKINR